MFDTFDTKEEREPRHFALSIPSFVKFTENKPMQQTNVSNNDKNSSLNIYIYISNILSVFLNHK